MFTRLFLIVGKMVARLRPFKKGISFLCELSGKMVSGGIIREPRAVFSLLNFLKKRLC